VSPPALLLLLPSSRAIQACRRGIGGGEKERRVSLHTQRQRGYVVLVGGGGAWLLLACLFDEGEPKGACLAVIGAGTVVASLERLSRPRPASCGGEGRVAGWGMRRRRRRGPWWKESLWRRPQTQQQ
jgi:hypothetical protein